MEPQTRKIVRKLSNKEVFQLYKWLEDNVAKLPEGCTREQAAKLAEEALGFSVYASHIDTALVATEVELPKPAAGLQERIAHLERAFRQYLTLAGRSPEDFGL